MRSSGQVNRFRFRRRRVSGKKRTEPFFLFRAVFLAKKTSDRKEVNYPLLLLIKKPRSCQFFWNKKATTLDICLSCERTEKFTHRPTHTLTPHWHPCTPIHTQTHTPHWHVCTHTTHSHSPALTHTQFIHTLTLTRTSQPFCRSRF